MLDIAYVGGKYLPIAEAKVSLEDRANQFGDGVYEALLAFGHVPFAMREHLDRWERSCRELRLTCPQSRAEIERIVGKAIEQVEGDSLLVYMQVSRGVAPRNHPFPAGVDGVFSLTVRPYVRDARAYDQGDDAVLFDDIRWGRCDIKCLNLLPNVLAMQKAVDNRCTQAIFQKDGVVTECASANMYIVRDGAIVTHPRCNAILSGVTRAHLLESARMLGIPCDERAFTVKELYDADEAFSSSVARRPTPVVRVEGHMIGEGRPGPIVRALQEAYRQRIAEACGVAAETV